MSKRAKVFVLAMAFLLVAACVAHAETAQLSSQYVEGELLVQMKPGIKAAAVKGVHAALGARVVKTIKGTDGVQLLKLPSGVSVREGLSWYDDDPVVFRAEPNYIRTISQTVPNDELFFNQWSLLNMRQTGGLRDADMDAAADPLIGEPTGAWDITVGDDPDPAARTWVVVIMDTGVNHNHPDLSGNMWRNEPELFGAPGVDDDGNGYTDDIFGINALVEDTSSIAAGNPMDDNGHGTHVAGIYGAVGNNSIGVSGVNWYGRMMACKFLNSDGVGTLADELECLYYIADMADALEADPERPEKIVAVNASFGGLFHTEFEVAAIDELRKRGILVIAAAGNEGLDNDALYAYPASYDLPNIISVAATNNNDVLANFSSYGRRTVDIGAPGVSIWSTLLRANPTDPLYGPLEGMSGTSMAAPHVTGVVGLLYSQFPSLEPITDWPIVKNRVLTGGDPNELMAGRSVSGRRLNARGSLECSDNTILTRLTPVTSEFKDWIVGNPENPEIWLAKIYGRSEVTVIVGTDSFGNPFSNYLGLSALHVNCGEPNGDVVVDVGATQVTLLDDGDGSYDYEAGDGVYSAHLHPPAVEDDYVLTFPNTGTTSVPFVDTFTVHVRRSSNPFVVADAGNSRIVLEGTTNVMFDGSISSGGPDSIFKPLFYEWEQVGGDVDVALKNIPETSYDDTVSPWPVFDAPEVEDEPLSLLFRLTVTDLEGNSDADYVSASVWPELTGITLLSPDNAVTLASPPTFIWEADGGLNNIFVVDLSFTSDFSTFWSTFKNRRRAFRGTSWHMPVTIWNAIDVGAQVFWRVRGMDLFANNPEIITSEARSFTKE